MRICLRYLALLLALWLPLQTAVASVLPPCSVAGAVDAAHHDDSPPPHSQPGDAACDDCAICHLSCAGVPPAGGGAWQGDAQGATRALPDNALTGFTPPIPHRPPLRRAA